MPRAPRIWFPGAWYHIMARGNNREPLFFADGDYLTYLNLLQEGLTRCSCRIHAYALMTNHLHLMIETGDIEPISRLMQWLHTTYTCRINRSYHRVGHLFQGRYRSVLVERDTYALELSRYIHLNPVRAGLVADPLDYPWSSYRAYLKAGGDGVATTEQILGMICHGGAHPQAVYRQFVLDGLSESSDLMAKVTHRQLLGSPQFIDQLRSAIGVRW